MGEDPIPGYPGRPNGIAKGQGQTERDVKVLAVGLDHGRRDK